MKNSAMRLSDAERDAAAADLGEHFVQGRLSAEEHDERVATIWAAKTRGEIAPVFIDLPSPYAAGAPPAAPSTRRATQPPARQSGWRRLPAPVIVLLAVLLGAVALAHLPIILVGLVLWWFVAHSHHQSRRRSHDRG